MEILLINFCKQKSKTIRLYRDMFLYRPAYKAGLVVGNTIRLPIEFLYRPAYKAGHAFTNIIDVPDVSIQTHI